MSEQTDRRGGPSLYVGYLPMSAQHRLFVLIAAPLLVFAIGALAGAMAASQRDPGSTEQLSQGEAVWRGTVLLEPFPMLATPEGDIYLLASTVKSGVEDRVRAFDGQASVLTGSAQMRDGRRVLLVADGDDAIVPDTDAKPHSFAERSTVRQITVVGEILDSKCYTGAMKPGEGKAHKACAILCLRGGIAAVVTSPDMRGEEALPLLRVDGQTLLPDAVLELVGEPVEITGTLRWENGLPVLDSSAGEITRWSR